MKQMKYLAIGLVSIAFASCTSSKQASSKTTSVVESKIDTISYGFGFVFAKNVNLQLEQAGVELDSMNKKLLVQAFEDVLEGNDSLVDGDRLNTLVQTYVQDVQAAKLAALTKAETDFLLANKERAGVVELASGLQYEVLKEGVGPKPSSPSSVVKVHYHGTLKDGTIFDSSVDRGQPSTFPLNRVIRGWTEGVQLMSVGSKYRFYIPYTLGYGEKGSPPRIPAYATLVFDVELLEIVQ